MSQAKKVKKFSADRCKVRRTGRDANECVVSNPATAQPAPEQAAPKRRKPSAKLQYALSHFGATLHWFGRQATVSLKGDAIEVLEDDSMPKNRIDVVNRALRLLEQGPMISLAAGGAILNVLGNELRSYKHQLIEAGRYDKWLLYLISIRMTSDMAESLMAFGQ